MSETSYNVRVWTTEAYGGLNGSYYGRNVSGPFEDRRTAEAYAVAQGKHPHVTRVEIEEAEKA